MDIATLQSIRDAFGVFRETIATIREARSLLPALEQRAVEDSLDRAGTAAALAEAEIAKGLGYQIHTCTWPPQIMLAVQTAHGEESRCSKCGYTTRFHAPLVARQAKDWDYDPLNPR